MDLYFYVFLTAFLFNNQIYIIAPVDSKQNSIGDFRKQITDMR